jgi:hypothetical protein
LSRDPYRQTLAELELSIQRYTDAVPDDGGFYLLRGGEILGRHRTLNAAQEAWLRVLRETTWKPEPRQIDPADARRREQAERWSRNRAG